ncbi:MAG TPA: anti-sigma factor [Thermoanaerobaculia bacterium]|nr:anti-sigma factor [Thermoanaerobaculia bacterium]
MNHTDFESIAALDALGVASAGDTGALRLHLAGCLPCRRARVEYHEAASLIGRSLVPAPPPAFLRARIVAEVQGQERRSTAWWLATAASLFLVLWGWREVGLRNAAAREAAQRTQIAELQQEKAKLSAEIAALAAAGTKTIALSGQEVAPRASARVFLEPERRRAIVFFNDLPANPGDKSYQLWIIRADQPKPMSAGVFDVTASGTASISIENLPVATEIKALAVTLEPRGGVEQPTNTRFYVAGNAGS